MSEDSVPLMFVSLVVTYKAFPSLCCSIKEGHVIEESFVTTRGSKAVGRSPIDYSCTAIVIIGVIIPSAVVLFVFSLSECVWEFFHILC